MTGVNENEKSEEESEEVPSKTKSEIETRHKNSEMCEVADPELWMYFNHRDDSPDFPEEPVSESELALHNTMRETNEILVARERRLESECNEAEARNSLGTMNEIEGLLAETRGLRYNL
jgi:hypothetical protein